MTVVTDVTVPAGTFAAGALFETHPEAEVELARVVPLADGGDLPLFWVAAADATAVEATLRDHARVDGVWRRAAAAAGRTLFEVSWADTPAEFVDPIRSCDGRILSGEGTADEWHLRLSFGDRGTVSQFTDLAAGAGVPVTLHGVADREPPGEPSMTEKQARAVALARERGYFDVPRATDVGALADEVGISDNAFSQRLRRGLSALLERERSGGGSGGRDPQ